MSPIIWKPSVILLQRLGVGVAEKTEEDKDLGRRRLVRRRVYVAGTRDVLLAIHSAVSSAIASTMSLTSWSSHARSSRASNDVEVFAGRPRQSSPAPGPSRAAGGPTESLSPASLISFELHVARADQQRRATPHSVRRFQ